MPDDAPLRPLVIKEASWEVPAAVLAELADKRERYALVIPVINEGERIRRQLKAIAELAPALDVIIADGGSTDGSLDLDYLRSCGVRALLVKRGPGRLSAQLRMAYAWALQEGYDGIVTVDGNGKDGVEALPRFVAELEAGIDYIQGSRYRKGGAAINTPPDRKLAGRLIHAPLLSLAAGEWFTDTTNGFRGYTRRYLTDPRVAPFRDRFDRYNLLFYLTLRAGQLGYKSKEVPVRRSYPEGEKTPTKISGLSGRVSMMVELLRCCLGGCHPQGFSPFAGYGYQHTGGTGWASPWPAILWSLTGLFILITRAIPLLFPHDPWLDEAMLMANLPLPDLGSLFQPLPLFEQAAPLGYLVLANAVTSVFPDAAALPLRGLSVVASLIAAYLTFLTVRRLMSGASVPLAVAFVCLSYLAVVYSVEIKQYIFEYFCSALMMYLSLRYWQNRLSQNLVLFTLGGLASILFSFTAPILIASVGTGLLAQRWVKGLLHLPSLWRDGLCVSLAFLAVMFLFYFIFYTHPVTETQLAAFAVIYDAGKLSFTSLVDDQARTWFLFPQLIFGGFADGWIRTLRWLPGGKEIITWLFLAALLVGGLEGFRKFPFLSISALVAAFLIFVLSLAGLFPITEERHFAFMVPLVGPVLAIGLFRCLGWLSYWYSRGWSLQLANWLTLVVVAYFGVSSLVQSTKLARQEVSPLITYLDAHNESNAPVWVYYGAQPAMRVLAPDRFAQLGQISHASSKTSWVWENRVFGETVHKDKYLEEFRRTLRGLPEVWLLFSHYRSFEYDGLILFFAIAEEEVGDCRQVLKEKGTLLWKCG